MGAISHHKVHVSLGRDIAPDNLHINGRDITPENLHVSMGVISR